MTFPDFIRAAGIIPPESIESGRTQRCATELHPRKRNGLVRLDADGRGGIAINYESGETPLQWRADGEKIERDLSADNAARSARIAKKRKAEREGAARAKKAYDEAEPLRANQSDYIAKKRLTMLGCYGLRVDAAGNLIVPVWRDGKLITIQRISATGEKKFEWGAPSKFGVFWIERPRASVTVLCEGLATGLTLFEALPTSQVCVTFSASNMVAVAEREDWRGLVCVAADDDKWTQESIGKNPGIEAAEKAAKAIGCGVALPKCEGTDFNDWFTERLEKAEEAEEFAPRKTPLHKLRAACLAPIAASLMRAAKMVPVK